MSSNGASERGPRAREAGDEDETVVSVSTRALPRIPNPNLTLDSAARDSAPGTNGYALVEDASRCRQKSGGPSGGCPRIGIATRMFHAVSAVSSSFATATWLTPHGNKPESVIAGHRATCSPLSRQGWQLQTGLFVNEKAKHSMCSWIRVF